MFKLDFDIKSLLGISSRKRVNQNFKTTNDYIDYNEGKILNVSAREIVFYMDTIPANATSLEFDLEILEELDNYKFLFDGAFQHMGYVINSQTNKAVLQFSPVNKSREFLITSIRINSSYGNFN